MWSLREEGKTGKADMMTGRGCNKCGPCLHFMGNHYCNLLLPFQNKGLIGFQGHLRFAISILHIGDKSRRSHKLVRNRKGSLVVAEAAYYQQLFFIQRSGVDEQFFTVFQHQIVLTIYHDWIFLS